MTPELRKIHRRTWRWFSILLPVLILIGAGVKPVFKSDTSTTDTAAVLQNAKVIGESRDIKIMLSTTQDSTWQLGVNVLTPFEFASAVVKLNSPGKDDLILGTLNHIGVTLFPVHEAQIPLSGIIRIEDVIKSRTLRSIPFHR